MQKFNATKIPIRYLLKTKYYINIYKESIKEKLLSDSISIELLLSNYTDSLKNVKNFPGNISVEEWNKLLDEYIENPQANPNYLSMIEMPIKNFDRRRYFTVTPKQKIRIAKINNENIKSKINSDSGLVINSFVYLDKEKYNEAIERAKDELSPKSAIDKSIMNNIIAATGGSEQEKYYCSLIELIDKKQIEANHSFTDLLEYFKDQFNFFSKRMISKLPSLPNKEMGIISRTMGVKTSNYYESGIYFNMKNKIGTMKIKAIASIIDKWNIRLEDIIFWYFSEYCNKQYNVEWLHFNLPHKDESIDNRTSTIFRIEESIRTQLSILISDGVIDRDLVNATPTPRIYRLNSLFIKKYVSLADNKITNLIVTLMFSDQTSMGYLNEQKYEDTLFELLSLNKIFRI